MDEGRHAAVEVASGPEDLTRRQERGIEGKILGSLLKSIHYQRP